MRYKWFKTHEEVYEELLEAEEEAKKHKYEQPESIDPASPEGTKKRIVKRNELFGTLVAIVVLLYGLYQNDVPIIYVGLSFLLFEGRFLTKLLNEPKGEFLDRILYILSIFLFFGAFIIAFT